MTGAPPNPPPPAALASPGSRLAAAIVDGFILGLAGIPVLVAGVAARQASLTLAVFVFVVGWLAIEFGLPAHWSSRVTPSSPGKRAMDLHVIGTDGRPIGFRRGLVRSVMLLLGALPLYLGLLWMLWDPKRQGWQDKAAHSLVIKGEPVLAPATPAAEASASPDSHGLSCPVCGFELGADGICTVCARAG